MNLCFPIDVVLHRTPLSSLQQKFLLEELLGYREWRTRDCELGPRGCMIVWVATFLSRLAWLAQEQWRLLIQECSADLGRIAVLFKDIQEDKVESYVLSFVDGRYATWTGVTQFLNLETGDWVPALEHRGFEHIGYDLLTLAIREDARCTRIREHRNADTGSI